MNRTNPTQSPSDETTPDSGGSKLWPFSRSTRARELAAKNRAELDALRAMQATIDRSSAVVELDLDGTVVAANDNFLGMTGYALDEILGRHHGMFVAQGERESADYEAFWTRLREGTSESADYRRVRKDGSEIWLRATYSPVLDAAGRPHRIVTIATDVTALKIAAASIAAQLDALHHSQAVIEFALDGTILSANDNFLNVMGYTLAEVEGQHHSMFVTPEERVSREYEAFWASLRQGQYRAGEFRRIAKGGSPVWIQASYNPVNGPDGKPISVVKFASDITARKIEAASANAKLEAINRSQAVIEFELDGTIITANENFLSTVGYSLAEIEGRHHSIFVDPAERESTEYAAFWPALRDGNHQSGEFRRIAKDGGEVWFQATYSPVLDAGGNPVKIVGLGVDVTARQREAARAAAQIEAIDRSQAVIEFDLDGTVLAANENFLSLTGYSLRDIQGQAQSMFVRLDENDASDDRSFWETLRQGGFQAGEYRYTGKDGQDIWVQARYYSICDPGGRPTAVVAFATDIGSRVQERLEQERAVDDTLRVLEGLSRGDLRLKTSCETDGPLVRLMESANGTIDKLTEVVASIRSAARAVSSGAAELSDGNLNLSKRTEQQAASLEETASSMEQMTSTVVQNADNAQQAKLLAAQARDQAVSGGDVVTQAIGAMDAINESSKKISDIIGVIDEIAFQTNLLALNASVEAARAGEQGRGFAVVASEVRNLAGRSATAAKEIKELIQDSSQKVSQGSRLVNESGNTLEEIVVAVKKVSDIVAEIAAAGQEQSLGIEQVNKAVMQMDEMTQQNAALVEEAAAASASISTESTRLSEMMSFFVTSDEPEAATAPMHGTVSGNEDFDGPERRSQDRPWRQTTGEQPTRTEETKPQASQSMRTASAVGDDVGDSDWDEF